MCVAVLALAAWGAAYGREGYVNSQDRSRLSTLRFPSGPAVTMCIPDAIEASFLPDNQSLTFRVTQMQDGAVRFVRGYDKPDQSRPQLLAVAAYTSAVSWQEVVARHRAAPRSSQIGEFVFKSIDPFVDLGRYFAVSTSRPVNFFVDLRSTTSTSVDRRRAQLTAIVDSISGYLNATECN
jgi:hypothetical protein